MPDAVENIARDDRQRHPDGTDIERDPEMMRRDQRRMALYRTRQPMRNRLAEPSNRRTPSEFLNETLLRHLAHARDPITARLFGGNTARAVPQPAARPRQAPPRT